MEAARNLAQSTPRKAAASADFRAQLGEIDTARQRGDELYKLRNQQNEQVRVLADLLAQIDVQLNQLWQLKRADIAGLSSQFRNKLAIYRDQLEQHRENLVKVLTRMGWDGTDALHRYVRTQAARDKGMIAHYHPEMVRRMAAESGLRNKLPTLKAEAKLKQAEQQWHG